MNSLFQKLNFHLGALAAAEDRPAIYPNVDFCTQPDSICTEDSMEMRFVVGMFEWVSSRFSQLPQLSLVNFGIVLLLYLIC